MPISEETGVKSEYVEKRKDTLTEPPKDTSILTTNPKIEDSPEETPETPAKVPLEDAFEVTPSKSPEKPPVTEYVNSPIKEIVDDSEKGKNNFISACHTVPKFLPVYYFLIFS